MEITLDKNMIHHRIGWELNPQTCDMDMYVYI